MNDHPYYDRTRLLVAKREDEEVPMVIWAFPQSTWEVVPEDEYDAMKRARCEQFFGPDWTAYDYIEIVVTIPWRDLAAMFDVREITPAAVEKAG